MQTRSMTRRTREEASFSLQIPSTDEVLSASLRTVVEEKLQEESGLFQSFPAGDHAPGTGRGLSTPPPSSDRGVVSSVVMSSTESFPSPRRHLVDPRLRREHLGQNLKGPLGLVQSLLPSGPEPGLSGVVEEAGADEAGAVPLEGRFLRERRERERVFLVL